MSDPTTRNQPVHDPTLLALVDHREKISAEASLEAAQKAFAAHGRDFMAAVDPFGRVTGLCAKREIAMLLSARFGFALNARDQVEHHLEPHGLLIRPGTSVTEVLQTSVSRPDQAFFEDVLLVDSADRLIGLIPMRRLVRLQDQMLAEKIEAVLRSEEEIRRKNEEMEHDLQTARDLQLAMLPRRDLTECGLRVDFRYLPSGGISGDSLEYVRLASGDGGVFVCDVMGHGVRAALITAMVRSYVQNFAPEESDPGALIGRLNRQLTAVLQSSSALVFVTAVLAVYQRASHMLCYVQAGHPTPVLWKCAGARAAELPITPEIEGPALGLEADFAFSVGSVPVEPGDRLLLFTDGLTEVGSAEDQFGVQGLLRSFDGRQALPVNLDQIISAASRHSGQPFGDDVCLLGVEFLD